MNPNAAANLVPIPKGVSLNPGGAPKGKRISTWMAEYGEMDPSKWPKDKKAKNLPANARIALARLRRALVEKGGERSTEIVIDRTEGAVVAEPGAPMLSQIAAAILALKAAGVEIRKPEPIEAEVVSPETGLLAPGGQPDDKENEDEFRAARLRRGRA